MKNLLLHHQNILFQNLKYQSLLLNHHYLRVLLQEVNYLQHLKLHHRHHHQRYLRSFLNHHYFLELEL
tara:strand:- start:173 stop:376 length:204 start_codon:yes stop_codon:yes gene_type:complete